jgi:chromatin segregation and condensation protein Rec8/ScpA/Scc1 (kleisin family)
LCGFRAAREGYLEIRQAHAFGPLYLKWLNRAPDESAA